MWHHFDHSLPLIVFKSTKRIKCQMMKNLLKFSFALIFWDAESKKG